MKRVITCALALGIAGAAGAARAEGGDCCRSAPGNAAACCATGEAKGTICLEATGVSAAELASRLSKALGTDVRVQGPSFATVSVKLCAKTPEEALAQAAQAINARLRPAFVFGQGPAPEKQTGGEHALSVSFRNASAGSAAFVAAAQVGAIVISDKPLTGKVTFQGKGVPAGMVMDVIATAAGVNWKPAYVLQIGPDLLAQRAGSGLSRGGLRTRPGSPLTHLHGGVDGGRSIAPAPGMVVKDPEAEMARLEAEAFRRQQLGEWATIFIQESPKEIKRAVRDLRIRVETAIQKLESYPAQNRHLGAAMWRARYERMLEDYKNLNPEQQKQVQPVLDAMKYFAAPGG
jgi:hypothetical protein